MNPPIRLPPMVLLVHDGQSVDAYISYLRNAGLQAAEAHADDALAQALALQPDVIVLDFECDGDILAALELDARTRLIPVIALTDLITLRTLKHSSDA